MNTLVRCFKHYCRSCHALHFVAADAGATAAYPRCCGRPMAYLGHVDAVPGREESLRQAPRQSPATARNED